MMAAIYDKALKRKDFSGIIGEKQKAEAAEKVAAAAEAAGPSKDTLHFSVIIYLCLPYFQRKAARRRKRQRRRRPQRQTTRRLVPMLGKS
jgi:hypothetical protein